MEPTNIESRLSAQLAARRERRRREAVRQRRLRIVGTVAALLVVGSVLTVVVLNLPSAGTRTITGTATCASGQEVQGIWVQDPQGQGGFATWSYIGQDRHAARFSYDVRGTRYEVHVGCGGNPQRWLMQARSEVVRGGPYDFFCFDLPTDDRYTECIVLQDWPAIRRGAAIQK